MDTTDIWVSPLNLFFPPETSTPPPNRAIQDCCHMGESPFPCEMLEYNNRVVLQMQALFCRILNFFAITFKLRPELDVVIAGKIDKSSVIYHHADNYCENN